jgi:hypothetical protein
LPQSPRIAPHLTRTKKRPNHWQKRSNKAQFRPFIELLVRFQPDDALFFLPLQQGILILFRPSPSFVSLRDDLLSLLCRLAGLHRFTEVASIALHLIRYGFPEWKIEQQE